jgi:hypothetical protein
MPPLCEYLRVVGMPAIEYWSLRTRPALDGEARTRMSLPSGSGARGVRSRDHALHSAAMQPIEDPNARRVSSEVPSPGDISRIAEVSLEDHQLELYAVLVAKSEKAGNWYRGGLSALANSTNPDRLPQAAHSIRELMDNLPTLVEVPAEADKAGLGDKFKALITTWERARRASSCHSNGVWTDRPIDIHLRRALSAVDSTIEWYQANRVTRRESAVALIRRLDVSDRVLPRSVENTLSRDWARLRDYFVKVCHHGRETDDAEFNTNLYALERFVLDRMKPKTSAEQATLDQLIEEAEHGH